MRVQASRSTEMPGYRLEISSRATRDIRSLLRYSLETWGIQSRDEYARMLDEALLHLADFPEIGSASPDLFAGARMLPVGHHVIYYQLEKDILRIIRVLHERNDASRTF